MVAYLLCFAVLGTQVRDNLLGDTAEYTWKADLAAPELTVDASPQVISIVSFTIITPGFDIILYYDTEFLLRFLTLAPDFNICFMCLRSGVPNFFHTRDMYVVFAEVVQILQGYIIHHL